MARTVARMPPPAGGDLLVGRARCALCKFIAAVAEPDDVRVRVDESGQDGGPASVDLERSARDVRSVELRLGTRVDDDPVACDQCGVPHHAGRFAEQRVTRAERADAVDHDRGHAWCRSRARVASPLQNLRNVAAINRTVMALTSAFASTSHRSAATT